jgi:hypothetical protein
MNEGKTSLSLSASNAEIATAPTVAGTNTNEIINSEFILMTNLSENVVKKVFSEFVTNYVKLIKEKDILKDAINEIADIFNPVGLSSAKLKMKRESFDSDNGRRAEEIRRKQLLGTASDGELKELDNIENGYLKLSIEENVYNGFKSGIESAIKETTYTNIFNKFGSMIGDAISKTALKNLNLDNSAQKVADLLTAGNYAEAGKEIRNISLTALAVAKQNEETAKKLREQGLDWTEIYGTGLVSNIYQDVTNELSSQNSLKNIGAKYKKSEIDLSNTMATDKYNNSEYYNELMNRKARGEFISENETIWIEQYESSLTNITNKQNLLNSLQSSFNSMLSNKTGLDYLKQVSQSIAYLEGPSKTPQSAFYLC